MKLSTRGRYGVFAMLDLAMHYSSDAQSIKSIAERQGISESYLEQLFVLLKKSGLINSVRGSQGGYSLARSPKDITVGEILRVMEGTLAPVLCVDGINTVRCDRYNVCVTKLVWEKIHDGMNKVVNGITLSELIQQYEKMRNYDDYMYYI